MRLSELLKTKTFWCAVALAVNRILAAHGVYDQHAAQQVDGALILLGGAALRAAIGKSGMNGDKP